MAKFDNAKVGDKVWSVICGDGIIVSINLNCQYPITVNFKEHPNKSFDTEGRSYINYNPELFWNEVKLPTEEEDKKPFDLVEFLKENFTKVDFTPWNDNLFIYYDYNRKELLIQEESIDDNIGTVYLKFNDIVNPSRINSVISKLNESKVVPHQLKQAYKELGWL